MLAQSSSAQSSRGSMSSGSVNGSIDGSVNSSSHSNVPLSWDNTHAHINHQTRGNTRGGLNTMSPSLVHHENVDHTLFNSVSEIPEQPSFLSLDPNFGHLNAEDDDHSMLVGGGAGVGMAGGSAFLPMLDGIESGGDYGLTDLSFNFV
ncbi:hypothetical protein F66182_14099 [Fusarium sp. NRRL 66182]|nr:hypothetical protein F66182_14099 [Fusarium sp. NRRL 66182]